MKSRRAARTLALGVLYEAEIRRVPPLEAMELREQGGWVIGGTGDSGDASATLLAPEEQPSAAVVDYARTLVGGVQEFLTEIDGIIASYAEKWEIQRMPVIDRNILRIAVFELLWRDDIPTPVAINEAVDAAKSLSTEDSGRFVNGLLGRVAEQSRIER